MRHLLEADEGWKVWIEWYEARLVGGPTYHLSPKDSEEIEVACALIPNEIWQAGPATVNAEIKRIVEEYSKLSPGERVTEESSDQPIDLGEGHLPQGRTTDAAISPQEVAEHRTAIRMSIDSLSKSIDLELERLGAKPNDTQKLEEWETRSSFLGELEARIFEIQNSLAMLPDGQSTPADEVTAGFLKSLATEFEVWLTTNRPDLVDWIARLGVASGFIGLMSMLGAYMPVATSIVLAMTCGKGARDIILGKQNNQKKD